MRNRAGNTRVQQNQKESTNKVLIFNCRHLFADGFVKAQASFSTLMLFSGFSAKSIHHEGVLKKKKKHRLILASNTSGFSSLSASVHQNCRCNDVNLKTI